MPRLRIVAIAILLLFVGGAALVAAAGYWLTRLPDPQDASRDQLLMWIVLRDLEQESPETQAALVDRFQEELLKGIDVGNEANSLTPEQQRRVARNIEVLKRVWFHLRVTEYAALPAEKKQAFLLRQIEVITRWTELPLGREAGDGGVTGFFDDIQGWMDAAGGDEKRRMVAGVQDGLVMWLATKDISGFSRTIKADLARRIIGELRLGLRLDSVDGGLSEERSQRLLANGELLLEAWLTEQAIAYDEMTVEEKTRFVNGLLDEFQQWGVVELLLARRPQAGQGGALRLMAMIDQWVARAEEDQREQLRLLLGDMMREVVWREITGRVPKEKHAEG